MAEKSTVRAPYNFVPFPNKVLIRYKQVGELPRHDMIDPNLKAGEIHVTMTAETPVFVSDGGKEAHFFRDASGRFAIPGSSIRGMTRQNMQILGFGLVHPEEDMQDYQVFFREVAAARESVSGELKEYYKQALDIGQEKSATGKPISVPRNVGSGYLRRSGDRYWIQPTKGACARISRKHPDMAMLGDTPARTVDVDYHAENGRIKNICPCGKGGPDMRSGVLLFTGNPVGRQPNHLYVFPMADEEASPVELSKADVLSYAEDWESRKNSLKAYYDPMFWALPEEGESKPVFFIRYNGHTYFGMSRFLRIGYPHALSEGLPKQHLDRLEGLPLDYPRAMFGFARADTSYRSRISFSDFPAEGKPQEGAVVETILSNPKPSYYPGYVIDGKHYAEDDFKLRGYKQYWLKEAKAASTDKKNAASKLRPLPAGTKFRGVIRYRNLHPDELGLLLWSLRLDEGCYQSIGMGKPYGFGRMKLSIDSLWEFDMQKLYSVSGLCANPDMAGADTVEKYIKAYHTFAEERIYLKKGGIRKRGEIKDFFFMRSAIRQSKDAEYMPLEEYKNVRNPLPSAEDIRKEAEAKKKEDENQKLVGQPLPMDDYIAMLAAKINKKKL